MSMLAITNPSSLALLLFDQSRRKLIRVTRSRFAKASDTPAESYKYTGFSNLTPDSHTFCPRLCQYKASICTLLNLCHEGGIGRVSFFAQYIRLHGMNCAWPQTVVTHNDDPSSIPSDEYDGLERYGRRKTVTFAETLNSVNDLVVKCRIQSMQRVE